jgi:hypothetical protein
MKKGKTSSALWILVFGMLPVLYHRAEAAVEIKPLDTKAGYLARLLLNETPFPGERGWVSEQNSKATMLEILWVCHGRIHYIPSGYRQEEVAAVRTKDIFDVITAGGVHGQCDGFYRDDSGKPVVVPRVEKRIESLLKIANQGEPGKFARLILYAQGLADAYVAKGIEGAGRFAGLTVVRGTTVTGRAYSWMTDMDCYNPGGDFVRIPDDQEGLLGGNRFFTLKKRTEK